MIKRIDGRVVYWLIWFVLVVVHSYNSNIDRYRSSVKVKGKVVKQLWGAGRGARHGSRYFRYPQIQFTYLDSTYLFGQSEGLAIPGRYKIGKKVTVIIPELEPEKAEIYQFFRYWVSLTYLFFSFMFFFFIYMMRIFYRWYTDFNKMQRSKSSKGSIGSISSKSFKG